MDGSGERRPLKPTFTAQQGSGDEQNERSSETDAPCARQGGGRLRSCAASNVDAQRRGKIASGHSQLKKNSMSGGREGSEGKSLDP
jgi:hypothetical protein